MEHVLKAADVSPQSLRAYRAYVEGLRGPEALGRAVSAILDALDAGEDVLVQSDVALPPKRTVRFVEDGEGYIAGDFGDDGEATMAKIAAGEYIVLGMMTYDANKIEDLTTDFDLLVADALLDALWCIVVPSSAVNYVGVDYDESNVATIDEDYLRFMACEQLHLDVEKVRPVAEVST